jgi:Uma2 family endonuclease
LVKINQELTVMITQPEIKRYTPEEYLEFEVASEIRHAYIDGEIVPMTGGTPNHNDIASNLVASLKQALKGKPYRVFILDQRLWIPAMNLYTYPDAMVLPRPIELQAGRRDTVINPYLIAEVLSETTKNYDRGEKFLAYRTIPTFQEYLLIDQYHIHVEHHVKTAENQWLLSEYDDPAIALVLNMFDIEIQIADLYEDLELEAKA